MFGVVLGARHKFAITGKLRVGAIVSAKLQGGLKIWYPERTHLGESPKFLQMVVFGKGIPGVLIFETPLYRCNICLPQKRPTRILDVQQSSS